MDEEARFAYAYGSNDVIDGIEIRVYLTNNVSFLLSENNIKDILAEYIKASLSDRVKEMSFSDLLKASGLLE